MDENKPNMEEVRAILAHFASTNIPVTNDLLLEYCNLQKFTPISAGVYSDYLFAQGHDARLDGLLPDLLALLAKIRNIPELSSDAEAQAIATTNEDIQEQIAFLMEDKGILYQDVELVTKGLGDVLKRALDGVGRAINNNAAKALMAAAVEKYGDPLTLKALGEATRGGLKGETTLQSAQAAALAGDEPADVAPVPAPVDVAPAPADAPADVAVDPAPTGEAPAGEAQ